MTVASFEVNLQSKHDVIFVTQRKWKLQRQPIPWRRNTFIEYLLFLKTVFQGGEL